MSKKLYIGSNLISGVDGKSAYQSWLDQGNVGTEEEFIESMQGVGFESVESPTPADGTATITLTNGDTITLDLNHSHPQYLKYVLCASEAEYEAITTKDSTTLYLIPETS